VPATIHSTCVTYWLSM